MAQAGADQTITSSGPLLAIDISSTLNCQVAYAGDDQGEFFGGVPGACATLLAVGGQTYGPSSIPAGDNGRDVAYTAVSQTAVQGTGTSANPYRITTTVDAGTTGLSVVQTDRYVSGDDGYTTSIEVRNTTGAAKTAIVYHAADCYLGDDDRGFGRYDASSGAISCTKSTDANSRIEQFLPLSAGSNWYEAYYGSIWQVTGASAPFPDACECSTFRDNGMGLSWDVTVPANGSVTRSLFTTFSPVGRQPLSTSKTAQSPTATAGGNDAYTITVSNPNAEAATITVTDTLPAGFGYRPGTTSGATTANPTISGQTLRWSGITVPAQATASLTFGVTVSRTPGTYQNNAGGESSTFTVIPTGPTAPVTVSAAPQTSGRRMVGNGTRNRATYASIVDCDRATANAKSRPFTVKWTVSGVTRTFQAKNFLFVQCDDDPAVPTPAAGFDTQRGTATGTLQVGNRAPQTGYQLIWKLVDGGATANDRAGLLVKDAGGSTTVFEEGFGPIGGPGNTALNP